GQKRPPPPSGAVCRPPEATSEAPRDQRLIASASTVGPLVALGRLASTEEGKGKHHMDHSTQSSSTTGFGEFADDEYTSGVYQSQGSEPVEAARIVYDQTHASTDVAVSDDDNEEGETEESAILPAEPRTLPSSMQGVVGLSDSLVDVYRVIDRVADTQCTILITGESGTGKELVAKAVHKQSQRTSKPFVAINCGAIPEALLESELFGHARGAFTGAHANKVGRIALAEGGTLFLDEIGE